MVAAIQEYDALSLLNGRSKRLHSYSYKLDGSSAQYGLDAVFRDDMECDEKNMSCWIYFADGHRRDGVGDLLEIGGIDCSRHIINLLMNGFVSLTYSDYSNGFWMSFVNNGKSFTTFWVGIKFFSDGSNIIFAKFCVPMQNSLAFGIHASGILREGFKFDVFECVSTDYASYDGLRHSKLFSEFFVCGFLRMVQIINLFGVIFIYFCPSVSATYGCSSVPVSILTIFFMRTPGQILQSVVGWVSIKMTAFHIRWTRADECEKNESMDFEGSFFDSHHNSISFVRVSFKDFFRECVFSFGVSVGSDQGSFYRLDPPFVRSEILPIQSRDRFPDFFHSNNPQKGKSRFIEYTKLVLFDQGKILCS